MPFLFRKDERPSFAARSKAYTLQASRTTFSAIGLVCLAVIAYALQALLYSILTIVVVIIREKQNSGGFTAAYRRVGGPTIMEVFQENAAAPLSMLMPEVERGNAGSLYSIYKYLEYDNALLFHIPVNALVFCIVGIVAGRWGYFQASLSIPFLSILSTTSYMKSQLLQIPLPDKQLPWLGLILLTQCLSVIAACLASRSRHEEG